MKKLILLVMLAMTLHGYTQELAYEETVIKDEYFTRIVDTLEYVAFPSEYNGVKDMPHLRLYGTHALSPSVIFTANSNKDRLQIIFYFKIKKENTITMSPGDKFTILFEDGTTIETVNVGKPNRRGIINIDIEDEASAKYLSKNHIRALVVYLPDGSTRCAFPVNKEYNDKFTPAIGVIASLFTNGN